MTPHQIQLVRSSYALVAPQAIAVAALFYGHLFEMQPSLRPLFRGDIGAQGAKLMQMLTAAVAGLDRIGALAPILQNLGRRHAQYGVKDEHYACVGAALLWTLEQGLGDCFTTEVREAWGTAYSLLADAMQSGAQLRAAA